MSPSELDNLAKIGKLKAEPPTREELEGLMRSGTARLRDAQRADLSYESRFDLAYNAAHAFALLALRRSGYRCEHRYLAFQSLPHTSGVDAPTWRVLAKAHERRNLAEYEGHLERDEQLLHDVIDAASAVRSRLAT